MKVTPEVGNNFIQCDHIIFVNISCSNYCDYYC